MLYLYKIVCHYVTTFDVLDRQYNPDCREYFIQSK